MTSRNFVDLRDEPLNDSWVELGCKTPETLSGSSTPPTMNRLAIEKLLLDAQRESSKSSLHCGSSASSRASSRGLHSPNTEIANGCDNTDGSEQEYLQNANWVWDWSSRPEIPSPTEVMNWNAKLKHPISKRRSYSIRNSRLMNSLLFSLENLPILIITHACTFILGAASVLIYMKKYCNSSPSVVSASMN